MLTFDVTLSGGQIGSQLISDEEEMAYALKAMAEDASPNTFQRIAEEIPFGSEEAICAFLMQLHDAIKAQEG